MSDWQDEYEEAASILEDAIADFDTALVKELNVRGEHTVTRVSVSISGSNHDLISGQAEVGGQWYGITGSLTNNCWSFSFRNATIFIASEVLEDVIDAKENAHEALSEIKHREIEEDEDDDEDNYFQED